MPLWGRNDQAVTANSTTTKESSNGAPIGTYTRVKAGQVSSVRADSANAHFGNTSSGSRAFVDATMFGNTTQGAFVNGIAVGVFGVDVNEIARATGNLEFAYVTTAGSGYNANAVVTLTFANGTTNVTSVNAHANTSIGKIDVLNITIPGNNYSIAPALTIAAPSAVNIVANTTGFSNTNDTLIFATANSLFQVGDRLFYGVPTGNTAIAGLTGNTFYYVSFANTTQIAVARTPGGANVDITSGIVAAGETHTVTGDTATGYVVVSGGFNKGIPHSGWVLRTEGTGGRAGRIQYEVLVAMGSLGAQTAAYGTPANVADASDNATLP